MWCSTAGSQVLLEKLGEIETQIQEEMGQGEEVEQQAGGGEDEKQMGGEENRKERKRCLESGERTDRQREWKKSTEGARWRKRKVREGNRSQGGRGNRKY